MIKILKTIIDIIFMSIIIITIISLIFLSIIYNEYKTEQYSIYIYNKMNLKSWTVKEKSIEHVMFEIEDISTKQKVIEYIKNDSCPEQKTFIEYIF